MHTYQEAQAVMVVEEEQGQGVAGLGEAVEGIPHLVVGVEAQAVMGAGGVHGVGLRHHLQDTMSTHRLLITERLLGHLPIKALPSRGGVGELLLAAAGVEVKIKGGAGKNKVLGKTKVLMGGRQVAVAVAVAVAEGGGPQRMRHMVVTCMEEALLQVLLLEVVGELCSTLCMCQTVWCQQSWVAAAR